MSKFEMVMDFYCFAGSQKKNLLLIGFLQEDICAKKDLEVHTARFVTQQQSHH